MRGRQGVAPSANNSFKPVADSDGSGEVGFGRPGSHLYAANRELSVFWQGPSSQPPANPPVLKVTLSPGTRRAIIVVELLFQVVKKAASLSVI